MRCTFVVVLLVACGGQSPAPKPVGNDADAPAAEDWRPDAGERAALEKVLGEARAAHDAGDDEACKELLEPIDEAWLGSELDPQVLEVAMACEGRDDDFCDYYLELDSIYCSLRLAIDLAPRRAYAAAAADPCDHGGRELSVAVPGEDRCVAIEPGAGAELEQLDGDDPPEGACPRFVLLIRNDAGTDVVELAREGESFLDSVSDCCHATELTALGTGDALRIVLSSGGPSRDCFGGTASVDELEVYRLDGDRLVLETQLSVLMH